MTYPPHHNGAKSNLESLKDFTTNLNLFSQRRTVFRKIAKLQKNYHATSVAFILFPTTASEIQNAEPNKKQDLQTKLSVVFDILAAIKFVF